MTPDWQAYIDGLLPADSRQAHDALLADSARARHELALCRGLERLIDRAYAATRFECPSVETLSEMVAQRGFGTAAVLGHLATCSHCREELTMLRDFHHSLVEDVQPAAPLARLLDQGKRFLDTLFFPRLAPVYAVADKEAVAPVITTAPLTVPISLAIEAGRLTLELPQDPADELRVALVSENGIEQRVFQRKGTYHLDLDKVWEVRIEEYPGF